MMPVKQRRLEVTVTSWPTWKRPKVCRLLAVVSQSDLRSLLKRVDISAVWSRSGKGASRQRCKSSIEIPEEEGYLFLGRHLAGIIEILGHSPATSNEGSTISPVDVSRT